MTGRWPRLDWREWRETALHLQLMTQIVGKVRLARTPWLNHGWHVPLYVTPRGLATGSIPHDGGAFAIEFDLAGDRLAIASSGECVSLPLGPGSIAGFHRAVIGALADLGIEATIDRMPNEMADPVRFDRDLAERPWDGEAVRGFHRALLAVDAVFAKFRTGFLGKTSPVHFFWGSFDLAVTRFSGRPAPPHPGGIPHLPDAVTREAYSHEVSSAGFWPGSDAFPEAAFYSYAWSAPPGFGEATVAPGEARFVPELGEFVLPYAAVRAAPDPDAALLAFLQSTYAAAADLGGWDRAALECALGEPGLPRTV